MPGAVLDSSEKTPPPSPGLSHPRPHFAWLTSHHHSATAKHGSAVTALESSGNPHTETQ